MQYTDILPECRKRIYLISFLTPVAIVAVILLCCRVFPFGEECFLRTDLYHQYAPFYAEFCEKLKEGSSLFYSGDVGLGVNFLALYAYYLASPLNWLLIFIDVHYVIEFMTVEVLIKFGLAGFFMSDYLLRHSSRPDETLSIFGIFYALSGFMCAYYWNLMWLDAVMLFPLVMRAVEDLVFRKKYFFYTAVLGFCIISNYFICIMMCIFLVFWFFALNILSPPGGIAEFTGRGLRFAVCSLIAGGLAAFLLIPEIYALQNTAAATSVFPGSVTEYFSAIKMLTRHLPCVETEQGLEHWPNIYCGLPVFILIPLYIGCGRIQLREKAVYLSFVMFFLLGFSVNVLNYIWHGFHYPNSLPARQSYIYVLLVLFMCMRIWDSREYIGLRQLGNALCAGIVFILIARESAEMKYFHFAVFYGSVILLSVYAGVMYLELTGRLGRKSFVITVLALVILEAGINTAVTSVTTTSRKAFTADNDDVRALVSTLEPSNDFYRVEKISRKTRNDGAWMNFPSASVFSSVASRKCTEFYSSVGCEASTNAYGIGGSTPFVNMLLSVKYALYSSLPDSAVNLQYIDRSGDTYLYRNENVLPAGFAMPAAMAHEWKQTLDNPALVQNALCDQLGLSPVLVANEAEGKTDGKQYSVTISKDGEYYAYVTNGKIRSATVNWPDKKKTFENLDRRYLIELGSCSKGDRIRITSETADQNMNVQIYRFDYDALSGVYGMLSGYPFEISVKEEGHIEGNITVDTEKLGYGNGNAEIFFSIPFDRGWTVFVDGEETGISPAFDTFLSFSLPSGTHSITMDYFPEGLGYGAILSGISLIALITMLFYDRRGKRKAAAPDMDAAASDNAVDAETADLSIIGSLNTDEPRPTEP